MRTVGVLARAHHFIRVMIEIVVPALIALVTGAGVITNRIYTRILEVDKRVDTVELRMAEAYVSKGDLQIMLSKMEGHMERIEDKLDALVANGKCNNF